MEKIIETNSIQLCFSLGSITLETWIIWNKKWAVNLIATILILVELYSYSQKLYLAVFINASVCMCNLIECEDSPCSGQDANERNQCDSWTICFTDAMNKCPIWISIWYPFVLSGTTFVRLDPVQCILSWSDSFILYIDFNMSFLFFLDWSLCRYFIKNLNSLFTH